MANGSFTSYPEDSPEKIKRADEDMRSYAEGERKQRAKKDYRSGTDITSPDWYHRRMQESAEEGMRLRRSVKYRKNKRD